MTKIKMQSNGGIRNGYKLPPIEDSKHGQSFIYSKDGIEKPQIMIFNGITKKWEGNGVDEITTDYSSYTSVKDGDYYTTVEYKRADSTLYLKSVLSNKDISGNFQTCTLSYYDTDGTTIIGKPVIWTFEHDTEGKIISKVVSQ